VIIPLILQKKRPNSLLGSILFQMVLLLEE
jgi:hypothetical protein